MRDSTAGIRTVARSTSSSRRLPDFPSISVIVTSVPGLPLIRLAAAVDEIPPIGSPSTATISSPASMPAFSAGVSSKTRAMRRPRFDSMTLRPIPANSPEVDCWKRR